MYGRTNDFAVADPELREAVCAAYNEWVWDFCSYALNRLVSVAQLPGGGTECSNERVETSGQNGFTATARPAWSARCFQSPMKE
jgi:hypothetical protein